MERMVTYIGIRQTRISHSIGHLSHKATVVIIQTAFSKKSDTFFKC